MISTNYKFENLDEIEQRGDCLGSKRAYLQREIKEWSFSISRTDVLNDFIKFFEIMLSEMEMTGKTFFPIPFKDLSVFPQEKLKKMIIGLCHENIIDLCWDQGVFYPLTTERYYNSIEKEVDNFGLDKSIIDINVIEKIGVKIILRTLRKKLAKIQRKEFISRFSFQGGLLLLDGEKIIETNAKSKNGKLLAMLWNNRKIIDKRKVYSEGQRQTTKRLSELAQFSNTTEVRTQIQNFKTKLKNHSSIISIESDRNLGYLMTTKL